MENSFIFIVDDIKELIKNNLVKENKEDVKEDIKEDIKEDVKEYLKEDTDVMDDVLNDIKETKTKYNYKKYNKTFYEKNKDKISEKIICNVCMGSYTYFNKSIHNKSVRHIRCLNKPI